MWDRLPHWLGRMIAYGLVVIAGAVGFIQVAAAIERSNTAIERICDDGNARASQVNAKNAQLVALFLAFPTDANKPPDPAILDLFEAYRQPIPLVDCDGDSDSRR